MLKVYDYICESDSCGQRAEYFVKSNEVTHLTCKVCNSAQARRAPSAPLFQLEGQSGDYPTAADKWANDHERNGGQTDRR